MPNLSLAQAMRQRLATIGDAGVGARAKVFIASIDFYHNLQKGCSASAERQALIGSGRQARDPEKGIHRISLGMGGISPVGVMGAG